MKRRTKYVGAVSQLALALALSGCGAGADASSGGEADDKIGSVTEALTIQRGTSDGTNPLYIHWDGITLDLINNDNHTYPVKTGWSAIVQIYNANPNRVHMRTIRVDLTCTPQAWGQGTPIETEFTFSGYIDGNGGRLDLDHNMFCPYGFGYPYIIRSRIYTESSFGD
jgi:hypothetical protein